jgi:hypothetical protein
MTSLRSSPGASASKTGKTTLGFTPMKMISA